MFIFKFFTQPHTKDTSVFVLNTQDPNNFFYFLSIKTESVKIQIKCLALCCLSYARISHNSNGDSSVEQFHFIYSENKDYLKMLF